MTHSERIVLLIFFIFWASPITGLYAQSDKKQVIALQAIFCEEEVIDALWDDAMANADAKCAKSYGARPHMTFASFKLNREERDRVTSLTKKLDNKFPSIQIPVTLSAVNEKEGYVSFYLIPQGEDSVLAKMHSDIYYHLDAGFERFRIMDEPNKWEPHITLFDIPLDKTQEAEGVLDQLKAIDKVTLKGFVLVSFGPVDYFQEISTRPPD